jgi:phosphoglycerol transferase MdoB-like AlkP superfamily enzyme
MLKAVKILKVLFFLVFIALFAGTGCVAAKQNPYAAKKKAQASIVNASQLGRNKYYFSTGYQKKLTRSYKK